MIYVHLYSLLNTENITFYYGERPYDFFFIWLTASVNPSVKLYYETYNTSNWNLNSHI